MPALSDIYRDYHKNDPQRLALLQQKVQAIRGLLSPAALAIFERKVSAWQLCDHPPEQVQLTWEPDYWVRPIREFIYDPHYLGLALGESIYPRIVDDLEDLFDGNYQEVILGGAQRWGKSVFAEVGIVYEIYRVSCLRDPGRAFGSLPGTKLAFVNASLTTQQARRVIFEGLFRLLKQSPYFLQRRRRREVEPGLARADRLKRHCSGRRKRSCRSITFGLAVEASVMLTRQFCYCTQVCFAE